MVVPLKTMFTKGIGSPVAESLTTPIIFVSWPKQFMPATRMKKNRKDICLVVERYIGNFKHIHKQITLLFIAKLRHQKFKLITFGN